MRLGTFSDEFISRATDYVREVYNSGMRDDKAITKELMRSFGLSRAEAIEIINDYKSAKEIQ